MVLFQRMPPRATLLAAAAIYALRYDVAMMLRYVASAICRFPDYAMPIDTSSRFYRHYRPSDIEIRRYRPY